MRDEVYREMEVKGLTLDPLSSMPIILLKDVDGRQTIPIWIGILEASAIASELEKASLSRPMTHDLIKNIIDILGAEVLRVKVDDLRNNTFYATIFLKKGRSKTEIAIDARPSDAIALALRSGAPIFVSEKVIERSRRIDLSGKDKDGKSWGNVLEKLSPEDFGKYKM